MQKNRHLTLRILAGLLAFALIFGILFVTNVLVGNPVSAKLADRAIQQYVGQKYDDIAFEIEKSRYSSKNSSYVALVRSKTSIDTKFNVYYMDGKVHGDDYESSVLGMSNTLERLSMEYSKVAKKIIASELGYKKNTTMVTYDKTLFAKEKGSLNKILALDMKFDKKLPMNVEVSIGVDLQDSSMEGIAKVLTDFHRSFVKNGCIFSKYGLHSGTGETRVFVNGVTSADIEGGNLVSLLQQAERNKEGNERRIVVSIQK